MKKHSRQIPSDISPARSTSAAEKASFLFLLLAILLSPIAFGSVESLAILFFESLCLAALACLLAARKRFDNLPGLLPLGLFCAMILIQLVPLPLSLLKAVSPGAYRTYATVLLTGQDSGWLPLSLDKKATLENFFRFCAYGAAYTAAVGILTRKRNIKAALISVVALGSLMALAALAQEATAHGKIYWFRQAPLGSSPFGPYVNRNHYAGFMVMVFPVAVALFSYFRPRGRDGRKIGLLTALADTRSQNKTARFLLVGTGAAMAAASVVLSGSRSGVLAVVVSLTVFSALSFIRKRRTGHSALWTVMLILIFIFAITALMGWGPVFLRLDNTLTGTEGITVTRTHIWADTLRMARDFPLTGSGHGSYGSVFPLYRTFGGQNLVLHAHNTYLELLAEGGLAAIALAAWFTLSVLIRGIRSLGIKGERLPDYAVMGAVSGAAAVLTQISVDFSLYPLANGIFFFFLLALITGASLAKEKKNDPASTINSVSSNKAAITVSFVVMSLLVLFHAGGIIAKNSISRTHLTVPNEATPEEKVIGLNLAEILAIRLDPLEGRYHYMACATEQLMGRPDRALDYCERALALEPADADHRLQMAIVLSDSGRSEEAESFYESSVKTDRFNPDRYVRLAQWYFSQKKNEKGFESMSRAMEMDSQRLTQYLSIMALSGIADEDMSVILPDEVIPYLQYASYLDSVENQDAASQAYKRALDILVREPSPDLGYFVTVKNYFTSKGNFNEAITVMEAARKRFPGSIEVLRELAALRQFSGRTSEAARTYREILKLFPDDRDARFALKRLERKQVD